MKTDAGGKSALSDVSGVGSEEEILQLSALVQSLDRKLAEYERADAVRSNACSAPTRTAPMTPIVLTLPTPVSANRYWRAVIVNGHAIMVPTKEAKAYKKEVALIALVAGIRKPLTGRIEVAYRLYPQRPQDWQARQRKDPLWADGVRCIDLGNANKVLEDALNGTVIEDDRWTWRLIGEKMEPDEHGARLVVWVRPIGPAPEPAAEQLDLIPVTEGAPQALISPA